MRRKTTTFASALAFLSLAAVAVFGGSAAVAAPPYTTDATIDSLDFAADEVTSGHSAQLNGTWSLPDNPESTAGFSIDLPEELTGRSDSFQLTDPETGEPVANCTVTETQLYCDFIDEYLEANPLGLSGDFDFWVTVGTEVTESTETTYDFETESGTVEATTTVNPEECRWNCDGDYSGQRPNKWGNYDNSTESITWYVEVPSAPEGMTGGDVVTMTDFIGDNQDIDASTLRLVTTDELYVNSRGETEPNYRNGSNVPASELTVTEDPLTVEFVAEEGHYYRFSYVANTTDGGASGTYTNQADFDIAGTTTSTDQTSVTRQGGGGTGMGTNVGRFSVEKSITGDAQIADTVEFSLEYAVTTPDGETSTYEGTVSAGGTFTSPTYPRGSTVAITEVQPTDSESVTWGEPTFSEDEFELVGGQETEITLVNEANLVYGQFEASKVIEGDQSLVDPETTFALEYSYPAGDGYSAGEGSMSLPADGAVVTSDPIPAGAEVTLTETEPSAIPGATWTSQEVSPGTITIDASEPAQVTVTNTIAQNVGSFSLTKSLSGTGESYVPDDAVFTVDYSYPAGDGFEAGSGTVEVAVGETATVTDVPAGAEVTLTEAAPDDVSGTTWGTPTFSEETFTIEQDTEVAITLENPIELNTGTFSIAKMIDGSGASLVPADTAFTVDYSYPAGEGYDAGDGSLTVLSDGTPVSSPELPYGAVVTLSEVAPTDLSGGIWTAAEFSEVEVTIGDGTVVEVTLTNTFEQSPTPSPSPTPGSGLPATGGDLGTLPMLAGLLLAAGAILVIGARRRAARGDA